MQRLYSVSALALLMALGACGETPTERGLSGAGIGAGVGAVGSAVTGGDLATGALVGGALGGAAGALTEEEDLNLGKPVWKR